MKKSTRNYCIFNSKNNRMTNLDFYNQTSILILHKVCMVEVCPCVTLILLKHESGPKAEQTFASVCL